MYSSYFPPDDYNRLSHASEIGKLLTLSITIIHLSVETRHPISNPSQYSSLALQGESALTKQFVFWFVPDDYQHLNHDKTNGKSH